MWKPPILLWLSVGGNSEKENHFLESRGQRVFLILKSHIYKLNNITMGCHVADANLRDTLNFPDHAQSIWILECFVLTLRDGTEHVTQGYQSVI